MPVVSADLGQIFRAEHSRLMRLVARMVGNPGTAEDLVQDVFVNLLRGGPLTKADNSSAYIARCATNIALDHLRRERARARYLSAAELTDAEASTSPLQDAVLQGRQELELLRRTISGLPPKCRVVFLLSRDHGLTMKEIAARLRISESTVEKHILRAMTECRAALRAAGRHV